MNGEPGAGGGPVFVFPDTESAGFTASVTALAACRAADLEPAAAAGYGGGEHAALVAVGALTVEAGTRLIKARAEALAEAAARQPGTMALVLGLDAAIVARCCADVNGVGVAVVAGVDAPGRIVISGEKPAVHAASELCRQRGAERVTPLLAGGAFHSPLMEQAVAVLRGVLALTDIVDPALPLISGVTASYARSADAIRANLAAEAACPVRWVECVERLVADGYTTFVECGPGTTLAERIRSIAPGAKVYSVNDGATLAATKEALLTA